jgi:hypothetical protein
MAKAKAKARCIAKAAGIDSGVDDSVSEEGGYDNDTSQIEVIQSMFSALMGELVQQ